MIIVDETSMVSMSLIGRLVEAIRPDARLVLVGDPAQLTSIEAGTVLGDVVGPASGELLMSENARRVLKQVTSIDVADGQTFDTPVGDGIVTLREVHRFGGEIATLAQAIRDGDGDKAISCLSVGTKDVVWLPVDAAAASATDLAAIRDAAVTAGRAVLEAAIDGNSTAALTALGGFRLLCAHRRGPFGAAHWMTAIEQWLVEAIPGFDPRGAWYVGRPLLVTDNDYSLDLYNGDTGVVVAAGDDRISAVFERRGEVVSFSPTRLSAVDTVYAMTIHKSQGSQFETAAVLLPGKDSPVLTRELLYTAVTRASEQVIVVGTEEAVREAVARPAARASGLRERLWEGSFDTAAHETRVPRR